MILAKLLICWVITVEKLFSLSEPLSFIAKVETRFLFSVTHHGQATK